MILSPYKAVPPSETELVNVPHDLDVAGDRLEAERCDETHQAEYPRRGEDVVLKLVDLATAIQHGRKREGLDVHEGWQSKEADEARAAMAEMATRSGGGGDELSDELVEELSHLLDDNVGAAAAEIDDLDYGDAGGAVVMIGPDGDDMEFGEDEEEEDEEDGNEANEWESEESEASDDEVQDYLNDPK